MSVNKLKSSLLALSFALAFSSSPAYAFTETTPVAQWVPTSKTYELVGVDSRQFMPYMTADPTKTYALTVPKADTLRFELHSRDVNPYDLATAGYTKERVEIGTIQRFAAGEAVHISYNLMVEPGAPATSWWGSVMGQMHEDGVTTSPPLSFALDKDNNLSVNLLNNKDPAITYKIATLQRGTTYKIDLFFKGGPQGRVVVVLNNKPVFDHSGLIGMNTGDFYWKLGIYRAASEATMAVNYSNLTIATNDAASAFTPKGLAPPLLRVNRASFITDIAGNNVPVGAVVGVYDNGTKITSSVGSSYKSFAAKIAFQPGIHYITADYTGSELSKELVVAFMVAADLDAQLDLLANASGLGAIVLTDTSHIPVPAGTAFATFIPKYKHAFDAITTDYDFVIYAGSGNARRADYYDKTGVKTKSIYLH